MHNLKLFTAVAGAMVLMSCSPAAGDKKADATDAGAAKAGAPGAIITAADVPRPQPGLWSTVTTMNAGEPVTMQQCIGPNEPLTLPGTDACPAEIRRIANGISFESQCVVDGATSQMKGSLTGDMRKDMTLEVTVSQSREGQSKIEMKMRGVSTYQGPCAPGQAPGLVQGN